MKKTIIFSHDSDIDGLGCVVLSKLAFDNLDYVVVTNVEKLETVFRSYLESSKLDKYDNIYITDLALYDPSLTMVATSSLRDKVLVFDHHKRAIESNMNRYDFTKIVEADKKGKRCATDLFYEYLTENKLLTKTKSLDEFVELIRLEDTWQWKQKKEIGIKAHDLAILFNTIGIKQFVTSMTNKLSAINESFSYNEEELKIIKNKKEDYEKILTDIMSRAEYFNDENNNKFGIVFSEYEYRNELAEYVQNHHNPESIKYLIIVAIDKGENGQKSYRSIDETFDVNQVAMNHGGGGHVGAATVNITKEQKAKALTLNRKASLKYLANSKYTK